MICPTHLNSHAAPSARLVCKVQWCISAFKELRAHRHSQFQNACHLEKEPRTLQPSPPGLPPPPQATTNLSVSVDLSIPTLCTSEILVGVFLRPAPCTQLSVLKVPPRRAGVRTPFHGRALSHRAEAPRCVYPSGDGRRSFVLSAVLSKAAVNIPVRCLCGRTFPFPGEWNGRATWPTLSTGARDRRAASPSGRAGRSVPPAVRASSVPLFAPALASVRFVLATERVRSGVSVCVSSP